MQPVDLYRDIVESSPDGVWVVDLEGRTVYANRVIARMCGVPEHEAMAMDLREALDPGGVADFEAHLAELREGRVREAPVEVQLLRRDGGVLWTLTRESPLRDERGRLTRVIFTFTDYTERRATTEALRTSEASLAEAQQIARIGGWHWDLDTGLVTVSPALLALYGLPQDEPLTDVEGFLARVHPDDRADVEHAVSQALAGPEDLAFVARMRAGEGWVWTKGRGRVHEADGRRWMAGTHQDVTEAHETELALQDQVAQNALMQTVASAANQARTLEEVLLQARSLVLLHDDWVRGRAFVPVADSDDLAPLHRGEVETAEDLSTPVETANELALARRVLRERRPRWDDARLTIGFPVTLDDEVCAVVTLTSDPPLYRHAMIEAMVGLVAGQLGRVAERERDDRALAAARDEAMAASLQKSEFLATMSHEIRTPLNGVIGLTDLLLRSGLETRQQRLASGVQVAGRALLGVINDILDFSKIEAGRLELETLDFEVRLVLDQVVGVLAESARTRGLDLSVSCHPDVPVVLAGDPTRLAQVLTNLVSNAVKFTETGGVAVRVTAAPTTEPAGDGGVRLAVSVSDSGVGVDPSELDHLFEPFTQADASTTRVYGGTGLGLAISREIVHAMGGDITYAPRDGGGSVFSFSVPLREAAGDGIDPAEVEARTLLSGHRVLVVDDVGANRLILEEQLSWWEISTVGAASAAEALDELARARAAGDPFDAVVLDLVMPGVDGLGLARAVRSDPAWDGVRLLVLTSTPAVAPEELDAAGVDDWLVKPVVTGVLRSTLVQLLGSATSGAAGDGAGQDAGESRTREQDDPAVLGRVLVVEDNAVNQMVATGLLEALGFEVVTVDDGAEGVARAAAEDWDVILMDVQMPHMDGYAATRAIRAAESGARRPIVAMTAAAVEGERERCLEAGMDDFLTKPVDPTALAATLGRWLGVEVEMPTALRRSAAPQAVAQLDLDRLEMLREVDEDGTYLARAIGNFVTNGTETLSRLRTLLAQDADPAEVRGCAHKLVGGALNLGARDAAEALRRVEHVAESGTTEGIEALLPDVEAELARAGAAMLAWRDATLG